MSGQSGVWRGTYFIKSVEECLRCGPLRGLASPTPLDDFGNGDRDRILILFKYFWGSRGETFNYMPDHRMVRFRVSPDSKLSL